jgi:hypothetical protein
MEKRGGILKSIAIDTGGTMTDTVRTEECLWLLGP